MTSQGSAGPGRLFTGRPPGGMPSRSSGDRIIAGVCGGLGERFDVDPLVFRVVFAAFTFVGGLGAVCYLLAWLILPRPGDRGERALIPARGVAVAVVAALVVVTLVGLWSGRGVNGFSLLLTMGIVAYVARSVHVGRAARMAARTMASPEIPTPGTEGDPRGCQGNGSASSETPTDGPEHGVGGTPVGFTDETAFDLSDGPVDLAELSRSAARRGYPSAGGTWLPDDGESGEPPREETSVARTEFSVLGPLVFAVLVITVGVMVGLHGGSWTAGGIEAILAATVVVVGCGLVVGAWLGRARWLIALGVLITIPLMALSALDVPLRGPIGHQTWQPTSRAAAAVPMRLAAGQATIDLTSLPLRGDSVTVTASDGAGSVVVRVPDDLNLNVYTYLGAGDVVLRTGSESARASTAAGIQIRREYRVSASAHPRGTVDLNVRIGVGEVEIERVTS